MDPYQISLILAFALALAELLTISFLLRGFGVGMLGVSLVQYVWGDYIFNRDVLVFAVMSLISFLVFRKLFRNRADQKSVGDGDINQY